MFGYKIGKAKSDNVKLNGVDNITYQLFLCVGQWVTCFVFINNMFDVEFCINRVGDENVSNISTKIDGVEFLSSSLILFGKLPH